MDGGGRGPATLVATRLRRSTEFHDAYTVRVADRRVAALATATPADARRWICTTRWLHGPLLRSGRRPLVVGLGVQWTPVRGRPPLPPGHQTPPPATLQLCAGHHCLVFHLARLDSPSSVPAALHRFLADPRVLCVGYGSAHDRRMLLDHCGLRVACGIDLRALAGMGGNVSVEEMAERFLGYVGVRKPREVAMSAWHRPRLDAAQVEYAAVDAYLAFRLGVLLCSGAAPGAPHYHHQQPPPPPAPVIRRAPPPAPVIRRAAARRAPQMIVHEPLPPGPRVAVLVHEPLPPVARAPEQQPALAPTAMAGDAAKGSSSSSKTAAGSSATGTGTEHGIGGLPMIRSSYASSDSSEDGLPMIRSSYSPNSDDSDFCSDEFELLGRESVTDEDDDEEEEEQHISDYLAGFLSDGEYVVDTGVPIDGEAGSEDGGGVEEYAGMGVLTVRDHVAEGYKEYTGILTVCNDGATYNDNDDQVLVVGNEEPEYYSVVGLGEAESYGNSTAEAAFNGGEDDGSYYCQDGGGVWYDQGDDDGDRYAQDDDGYDAFY